jgi:hypothetical protein
MYYRYDIYLATVQTPHNKPTKTPSLLDHVLLCNDLVVPSPVNIIIRILTSLICVVHSMSTCVEQVLASRRTLVAKNRLETVNSQDSQTVAIGLVADGKFERGINVALLLVTAHAHQLLTLTLVGHSVDQPGVS